LPPLIRVLALLLPISGWLIAAPNYDKIIDLAQQRYGQRGAHVLQNWRDQITALRRSSEDEQIRRVNEFINRSITFYDDQSFWNEKDYWATPLESMGRGGGDCEDYAIAKYISLRTLGIANDKLRLSYVKARIGGPRSTVSEAHMVLGYYPSPDAEPYILDNLIGDIRPASSRSDLTPVFSFNSEGIWTGTGPGANPAGSATARLSRWRDVIARLQAEGFE
jgi:predicted transglutaminase-like cysteine proteinase